MKLILYIGHHKVGSTSLQAFLAQNAQALNANGILYPMVDPRGLIHMLRQSIGTKDKPGLLPPHLREPHSALAYRMIEAVSRRGLPQQFAQMPALSDMRSTIATQIERLSPHTVILCSEVFSTFGDVNEALIEQLLALVPDVTQIQIYGVLRRPDQYLVSWHGQRLKVGEQLVPFDEAVAGYAGTVHLDYTRVLRGWMARCADARITLRNYADVMETGNSVRDFRKHADVAWPANLTPPPRINLSLPLPLMEIARRGNHMLASQDALQLRNFLMQGCGEMALTPNAQVDMLGAAARADLLARFMPVQVYLSQVSGRDAFFPNLEEIANCPPVTQDEAVRGALAQLGPDGFGGDLSNPIRVFLETLRKEYGLV
ncbi:hypothetical protein [uncultured Sulfitobacter sp.]|uniref:hypothetical protein n=1 Tax=uncultured Sulfitobacter sp. TaxID=191468 RepID=UPI00261557C9|nr:hypothetical protein [uncultured Sulfitobacter sp.]